MQTCTSLLAHDNCRSFTQQKPNSQRTTKVRLIGRSSLRPPATFVSAMSSVSCPDTSVKVCNNASTKKRRGTRRKRSENKHVSLNDANSNSFLPASQVSVSKACTSTRMHTDVLCTTVGSQSLPVLHSLDDNTNVALETVPVVSLSRVAEQPETLADGLGEVVKKRVGGRKSNGRAKLPQVNTVVKATSQKRKGRQAVAESVKTSAANRRTRCTSTTRNDKFLESMTRFVSEVTKNMISACVEQTFTQLIQKGLLFSPFASSLSVDNSSLSLPSQHSTINNSNFDQTYSFLQPCFDSSVSANCLSSTSPWNAYCFGAVQQDARPPGDFFASIQNLSPGFGFLGTQVEGTVASNAAAVCHETPVFYESATYNSFPSSSDAAVTCAYSDVRNVACCSQPVQSKNFTDYSLVDLLNMSDDDIDVLLSGFVDCLSDDQLSCNADACSAASTNAVVVSMDANTCHTDIPVCCSSVGSVTEVRDCYRNMDPSSNFYNIGEEAFQPDYYEIITDELDDDIDRMSVASLSALPDSAATSGEPPGKKITIRKPCSDSLAVSPVTRRKRQWRSSSRNDTASRTSLNVAVETTVVVSSSVQVNTQPAISEAQAPALDLGVMVLDEVLEGDG